MAMTDVTIDLPKWLEARLVERGWSARELARRAGMASTTILDVMNYKTNPGYEFCVRVGKALEFPPDELMRLVGLLPDRPDESEMLAEAQHLFNQLSDEDQERFLAQMRVVLELYRERQRSPSR